MRNVRTTVPQKWNNSSLTNGKQSQRKLLKQLTSNAAKLQAVAVGKSTAIHHHIEDVEPAVQPPKQGAGK